MENRDTIRLEGPWGWVTLDDIKKLTEHGLVGYVDGDRKVLVVELPEEVE